MRVLYITDSLVAWKSGIWFHRIEVPAQGLKDRGHSVRQIAIGKEIPDEFMEYPDVVVFGRTYPEYSDPVKLMRAYKKQGTRVIYDIDDDYWSVSKDNPSRLVSSVYKNQYEGQMVEADAITTTSEVLAKKIRKVSKKPIFICPNAIDYSVYEERPREHEDLMIGYMGAASHWDDLSIIVPVLEDLSKKHEFYFVIYGMVGEPIEAAMHAYNRILQANLKPEQNEYFRTALGFWEKLNKLKLLHIPFYPPELHPSKLSLADFDIALAPLKDSEFNRGKSCIKYYEYASVGSVTLASKVEPYKSECNYLAKNTYKDWYKKLEKLIVDKKFRNELLAKQQKWVKENRNLGKIAIQWEKVLQNQKGLKVSNQDD